MSNKSKADITSLIIPNHLLHKNNKLLIKDYPNLVKLESTPWEQEAYERKMRKEKEEAMKSSENYSGDTELDFSHMDLGDADIDGDNYPSDITSINFGDNYLTSLKVRNFANLTRLIISHNSSLTGENVIIENCPKLLWTYDYKSSDSNKETPSNVRSYNEATDNPLNEKNRPKHPKDWFYEGIEKKKQQFIKDALLLIAEIEADADKGDWKSVKEKLVILKKGIELYSSNEEIYARVNKLEQRLLSNQTFSSSNITKSVISSVIIGSLTIGLLLFLIKLASEKKKNKLNLRYFLELFIKMKLRNTVGTRRKEKYNI